MTETKERIAVQVNGESRAVPAGCSISGMLREIGIDPRKVAVERNLEVVPRSTLGEVAVVDGVEVEFVTFVGGG